MARLFFAVARKLFRKGDPIKVPAAARTSNIISTETFRSISPYHPRDYRDSRTFRGTYRYEVGSV